MKYTDAKKLHEGDQITIKEKKEICIVHMVYVTKKIVYINCYTSGGWRELTHLEIE